MAPRTAPPLETVTVPGVELCRLGTWPASTGPVTFSLDDFRDIVAANADPEVWDAAVKLGHTGALSALGDSEPAMGWAENLRIVGDRLVGDLVGVPAALAAIMPTAYRRRSVEVAWGVSTPSGKRYRAALTGLALLGVTPPAVSGLSDVLKLWAPSAQFQTAAAAQSRGSITVEAIAGDYARALPGEAMTAALAALASSASLTNVGDTSFREPSTVTGGGRVPLTEDRIRELLQLEQNADVEAALVAMRSGAQAAGSPAAGAPAAPAQATQPAPPPPPAAGMTRYLLEDGRYVDLPASIPSAEQAPTPPQGPVVPAGSTSTPPPATTPGTTAQPPADAAAILQALGLTPQPPAPASPAPGVSPVAPQAQAPAAAPAAPAPTPAPQAAPAPAVAASIDPALIAALSAQSQAGVAAVQELHRQNREKVLESHLKAGRIIPAAIESWRTAYDRDPAGTLTLLNAQPAMFGTAEMGDDHGGDLLPSVHGAQGPAGYDEFATSLGWKE